MANRTRRRRRSRNFVAIPFDATLALATLADATVLEGPVVTFGEDIYIMSIDCTWAWHTHTTGEGPYNVGWAHGDLTVTEVAEALNAEVTDPDDIIAAERARRPVRRAGAFSGVGTEEVLNNNVPIRTKCKFVVGNDHSISIWVQNRSGGPTTTGTQVIITGVIYGRWIR